ncbi:fibronectin type III-like domain-contianing protein [Methylocystis sp. B8]|uniref:fibronectin type III-like domain-contianing protein n=1 Tax=Methylocystis sp. B8 TaxID=544938 RepID=UPI001FED7EDA|nr:fibronectin type III-like domain-contianing protein [Methylocystis sp. B8]
MRDRVATVARPALELKNWSKVLLDAKETKRVTLTLSTSELRYLSENFTWVVEAGEFEICVGLDAQRSSILTQKVVLL